MVWRFYLKEQSLDTIVVSAVRYLENFPITETTDGRFSNPYGTTVSNTFRLLIERYSNCLQRTIGGAEGI